MTQRLRPSSFVPTDPSFTPFLTGTPGATTGIRRWCQRCPGDRSLPAALSSDKSTLRFIWAILGSLIISCLTGCRDRGTEPPQTPVIQLSVEEAGVTEAWLRIRLTAAGTCDSIHLQRDGVTVENLRMRNSDTVVVDEGLMPNHTYSYQAVLFKGSAVPIATSSVQLTTMDTTSHEFTWEIEYLGDGNSSLLRDVAIINDTLVYAVGEMYLRDSTGDFEIQAHNAARWNGRSWTLLRVQFYTFCGQSGTGSYPAKAIFALGPEDIWIAMDGSQVVRWNGQGQGPPMCTPVSVNKLWGTSPSSVYAVGYGGGIGWYGNGIWQKLESGITAPLDVHDIWGGRNPRTGEMEILAVASHWAVTNDRAILQINGTDVTHLSSEPIIWPLEGVWFSPGRRYYVAGSGIYKKTSLSDSSWRRDSSATQGFYIYAIRGTDINDVIAVGAYGEVVHYNGVSWRSYIATTGLRLGNYYSVALKGNLVVVVGMEYPRGVVAIGRR